MNEYLKKIAKFLSVLFFRLLCRKVFVVVQTGCYIRGAKVVALHLGNSILIEDNVNMYGCSFYFYGSNNKVIIRKGAKLKGVVFWMEDAGNVIEIGSKTTVEGKTQLAACEGTNISIGADCMFSHDIYIRTTDSHSIIDNSGKRINAAANISIGNHVWVGMQTLILKGSNVGDNCIVGARSTVTSTMVSKDGALYIGTPAKVLREHLDWRRER